MHASHRDRVLESARLYFPAGTALEVLCIDPRKTTPRVELAMTPRGEMPHIFGPIDEAAVVRIVPLAEFSASSEPDFIA